MNICVAILILKIEENMQHFWHMMLYYFKKDKITTETQKMICAVYGEGAVTDPTCRSGLQSFVIFLEMEISLWMMLHSRENQLKLIAIE